MARSMVRVLVVDDFESFRRFVVSSLGRRPEFQILCEAADGLEAVQQAEKLQPDLILLDIGLPKLNGIEAARQIRQRSPKSKILFVSQASSADIVQGALSTGAAGYIVKSDAGRELLTAVDAVLRGEQFIGSRFAGQDFTSSTDLQTADGFFRSKDFALPIPIVSRKSESGCRHEVHFYSSEESFLNGGAHFIGSALKAGNAAVEVLTELHRDGVLRKLQARGLDVDAAKEQGRYISLDAADALSTFMVDSLLNSAQCLQLLSELIAKAAKATGKERPRVAVFGECVHLLCAEGNAEAAIQMEQVGNQLTGKYDVDLRCGYSLTNFVGEQSGDLFHRICAEHSAVYCG